MFQMFEHLGRNQLRTATALASVFASGAGKIATEASEFAGCACSNHSDWLRELAAAKSAQDFVQAHNEFTKIYVQVIIDHARKLGAIASDIAESTLKTMPSPALNGATAQMQTSPVRAKADAGAA